MRPENLETIIDELVAKPGFVYVSANKNELYILCDADARIAWVVSGDFAGWTDEQINAHIQDLFRN